MGGDAPAECVFPAAGFTVTEKQEEEEERGAAALRRSRIRSLGVIFSDLSLPRCVRILASSFFSLHGGGARRLVTKPALCACVRCVCVCVAWI